MPIDNTANHWAVRWRAFSRLVRFPAIGATANLPLLGAVTVDADTDVGRACLLVAIGTAAHIYGFILNDVIDLPLDRTDPARSESPLVRGTIARSHALVAALSQLPIALALTLWAGGGSAACAALVAAFALGATYNLYGKKFSFPPVTDAVQGVAYALLTLSGALMTLGQLTKVTVAVCVYIGLLVFTVNGVHGSLRDLANDLRHCARTTAVFFGASPLDENRISLPRRFRLYMFILQALLATTIVTPLAYNWLGYDELMRVWTLASLGVMLALSVLLLGAFARPVAPRNDLVFAGTLHMLLCLGLPVVLLTPALDPMVVVVLWGLLVGPWLASRFTVSFLSWCANQLPRFSRSRG